MSWAKNRPGGRGYVNPKYRTAEHRAKVREYQALRDAGQAYCWRCGRWLPPGTTIHAGHHADGVTYAGPECPPCNRSDAATRARAKQTPSRGTGNCSNCGKQYDRRSPTQRFCSATCRDVVVGQKPKVPAKVRLTPLAPVVPALEPKVCLTCGAAHLRQRFCSKACATAFNTKTGQPYGSTTYEFECACCGVACASTYPNTRFCSDTCSRRAEKRRRAGNPERSPVLLPRLEGQRATQLQW